MHGVEDRIIAAGDIFEFPNFAAGIDPRPVRMGAPVARRRAAVGKRHDGEVIGARRVACDFGIDRLERAEHDMHAVLGRRCRERRGRIVSGRHPPRARIAFRKADEVRALARRAFDRADRSRDVLFVLGRTVRDRLHNGDAEGHGRAPLGVAAAGWIGAELKLRRCGRSRREPSRPAAAGRVAANKMSGGCGHFLDRPPPRLISLRDIRRLSPPPRGGRIKQIRSRDAPLHPSFATPLQESPSRGLPNKRREAERRKARIQRPHRRMRRAPRRQMLPLAALRARSPFGAPPRHSPRRTHPDIGSALSPALPETRRIRALPFATCLSPPRSAETGRSAGRSVARGRPGTVCETARGNRTRSTF